MKNRRLLIVAAFICLALIVAALPLLSACGPSFSSRSRGRSESSKSVIRYLADFSFSINFSLSNVWNEVRIKSRISFTITI